jgi:hypothetical protein
MQRLVFALGVLSAAVIGCSSNGSGSAENAGAGGGKSGSGGSGGSATGGSATGGSATGGSATGGSATGGSATGGASGSVGEGISAKYPGDVGIESDPSVIFADDFESYATAEDLWLRWDNVYQVSQTRIATEPENVHAGKQAVEFTLPQQTTELSNAVQKVLTNELDALYLRFHSKFDTSFDVVGSSHNGGGISAHYFENGQATPGVPADGTNKFLVEFECWRGEATTPAPGQLNVYIYHPEQRSQWGDHFFPTGIVLPNSSLPYDFGPEFVSRPDVTPELGRWYGYEVYLKANTPGQRDGRITLWVDGELIADFPNLRLRDIDTLTIDRFNLSLHAGSNPAGVTRKWYDNVVAATSYIGPMVAP